MPRLSITLTDAQAAALDRLASETGATKQSMIGLAVSEWLESHDRAQPSGWYGWADVQHRLRRPICVTRGSCGPRRESGGRKRGGRPRSHRARRICPKAVGLAYEPENGP